MFNMNWFKAGDKAATPVQDAASATFPPKPAAASTPSNAQPAGGDLEDELSVLQGINEALRQELALVK